MNEDMINEDNKVVANKVIERNYFLWLQEVTNLHPLIYDKGWEKFPLDLKKINTFNFQLLKYLFELLVNYTKSNAIEAFPDLESGYYLIKFQNDFYKIWQIKTTIGIVTFCQRVMINNQEEFYEDEFLDIESILNESSKELKK